MVNIDDVEVKTQLCDLASQPTFKQVRKGFMRGAGGGLLVHSIDDRASLDSVRDWISEIHNNCAKGKIPIVIVGNKIDLREGSDEILISDKEGQELATELS